MTDNEVITDFEKEIKYVRENEKYDDFNPIVDIDLCEDILALIKRQQAEVERLKVLVDEMSGYFPSCINCEGKTPLGERTDKCVYVLDDYDFDYCTRRGLDNIHAIEAENHSLKEQIKVAKAEAIKEFAKRLKKDVLPAIVNDRIEYIRAEYDIDNLAKEMTEECEKTNTRRNFDTEEDRVIDNFYEITCDFSELLVEYRIKHNMTQAQLAEKLGVSKVTVSRYENGNDNFSLKKLCEICAALDCDVSAVFRPAIAKSKATE